MAALIAVAETAQDIGSSLNKFLTPVDEFSADITALIAQCFNTSSALRRLNGLVEVAPRRDFSYISDDLRLATDSLDYTFKDVQRIFGGLARGGLVGAAYRRVWRDLQDFFYEESGNTLSRRLQLYQDFLTDLSTTLTHRCPDDEDEFQDTRDKIVRLLNHQNERFLTDDFQRTSLSAPNISKPLSFERKKPNAGQAPAQPRSPPRDTHKAARPRATGYRSPPMEYGFDPRRDHTPFAPDVPLSPSTSTTTNTVSSSSSNTQSSTTNHWLPLVFEQSQPTSHLPATGQTSACFGQPTPDASRKLAEEYVRLLDMPFENGDLVVRLYYRPHDMRSRFRCQTLRPTKARKDCCLQLTSLIVERTGASLKFIKPGSRGDELWAVLKFFTYEKLVLFFCSFIALRAEDTNMPRPPIYDWKLHGEEVCFAGEIVDDHYLHVLRILKDRYTHAIRLDASVMRGEMKKTPVWTAFITNNIHSRNWIRMASSKVVHLNELQRYIFTSDYQPQVSPTGEHELSFTNSQDAREFGDMLEHLVAVSEDR